MAKYEVTGPDGNLYEVEGPEGASDAQVISQVRRQIRQQRTAALAESFAPAEAEPERTVAGYGKEILKGIPAGIAGLLETGALGASALLPEESEAAVQSGIKDVGQSVRDYLAPSAGYEDSIIRKGAEALGSTVPFLAAAPFGIAGTAGAIGLGVAAGAGEAQQRAEAAGATPEEVSKAMPLGAVVGATEFLPPLRIFKRAVGDELTGGIVNYLRRVLTSAGEEGLQEATANIAQNLISRGLYDPEQGVFTGTGESVGYGAGVGGLLQALTELVIGRRARGTPDPVEQPPEEPEQEVDDFGEPVLGPNGEGRQPDMFAASVPGVPEKPQGDLIGPDAVVPDQKPPGPVDSFRTRGGERVRVPEPEEEEAPAVDTAAQAAEEARIKEAYDAAMARKKAAIEEPIRAAKVAEGNAPQGELFKTAPERTPAERDVIEGMAKPPAAAIQREDLTKLGVPATAPILRRVVGREFADPQVQADLTAYAKRYAPNPQVAKLINDYVAAAAQPAVEEAPAQGRMIGPKGGVLKKDKQMPPVPEKSVEKAVEAPVVSEAPVEEKVDAKPVADVEEPAAEITTEETGAVAGEPAAVDDTGGGDQVIAETASVTESTPKPEPKTKTSAKETAGPKPQFRGATETTEIAQNSKAAKQVAKILQRSKGKEAKPEQRQAEKYFNKYNRIADAVHVLGADIVLTRGVTQRSAVNAQAWIQKNMPKEVSEALSREIQKFSNMEQRGQVETSRREKMTSMRKDTEKQAKNYKKTDEEELAATPETRVYKKPKDVAKVINEAEESPDVADYEAEQAEYERQKFGGEYYGPSAMGNRRAPLHPLAVHALEQRDLRGALDVLTQHQNTRIANVARALIGKLGATKVKIREPHPINPVMTGSYNSDMDYILIDRETGLSPHILLHEVTHALTLKNLNNRSHPATVQLNNLFENVRDYLAGAYGTQDVEEFVAEAFSNPEFQAQLQAIHPDGTEITAWQKFVNIIGNMLRRLMGLSAKPIGSAQDTADELITSILEPNTEGASGWEVLYGPSATAFEKAGNWLQNNTSEPTKQNLAYVSGWADNLAGAARDFVLDLLPLNAVADIVGKKLPEAHELFKTLEDMAGARQKKTQVIRNTHKQLQDAVGTDPARRKQLNEIVRESTLAEVDPSDATGAVKYKDNADMLADWKRLRAEWNKMPKELQQAYTSLRDSYLKLYKELVATIENRIESVVEDPEQRKSVKQKILSEIIRKGKIEPYFPLYRKGEFWLSYRAKDPVSGNEEFYVEAFEDPGERARAAQILRTDQKIGATEVTEFKNFKEIDFDRVPTSFAYKVIQELKLNNLPKDAVDSVMEVFLSVMPETAFVQAFRKRKGTLGFQTDALSVFEERGVSLGQQIVSMQYDAKLQKLNSKINETAKTANDEKVHADAYRLRDYITFARNPKIATWGKVMKSVGFGMTLGFNVSSVLVNSTNIPVVAFPYLGGQFSFPKATKAIGAAYKLYMSSGLSREVETLVPVPDGKGGMTTKYSKRAGWSLHNIDYSQPGLSAELKELKELSELMVQRGQVTQSMAADALDFDNTKSSILTKVNATMGFLFHHGERMNRQVTAIAAYKLKLDEMRSKGSITEKERREAAEYAVSATELTNSGALLTTAPRFSQKSTLRNILFMYKRFGASMYYLQFKMAKELLASADPETRRVAKRQIIGLFASSAVMAGVQGVPLYGIVSMLGNLMFVDDDEEDFDTQALKFFGEPYFSGAINALTGTDVAARIGMTNLVFRSTPNKEQESWVLQMAEMLGGPVLGLVSRAEDGTKLIQDGEVQRGLEKMVPSSIANAMRGLRYATEGTTTLRGDPITGEVSPQHYMAQMLGFAPADYTRQLEINAVNKKVDRNVNEKRTQLLRKYYVAMRNYDAETMREILTEILELNEKHPVAAISADTLRRSMAQHAATSQVARKYGGVTINRNMQAEIDRYNAEYGE